MVDLPDLVGDHLPNSVGSERTLSKNRRSKKCPVLSFRLASVLIYSFVMVEDFCRQSFVSCGLQVGNCCTKTLAVSGSCSQFQPDYSHVSVCGSMAQ